MKQLGVFRVCFCTVAFAGAVLVQFPALAISAGPPVVVDFDDAFNQELVGWGLFDPDFYSENGVRVSAQVNHFDISHDSSGNGYLNIDTYVYDDCTVRFELEDGGLFYLKSLQVRFHAFYDPEWPDVDVFTRHLFEFSDGSSFAPQPVDGQWVLLDQEFLDLPALTYFTYTIFLPEGFGTWVPPQRSSSLDNITLVPVPEPGNLPLLCLGSLALVTIRRQVLSGLQHQHRCLEGGSTPE